MKNRARIESNHDFIWWQLEFPEQLDCGVLLSMSGSNSVFDHLRHRKWWKHYSVLSESRLVTFLFSVPHNFVDCPTLLQIESDSCQMDTKNLIFSWKIILMLCTIGKSTLQLENSLMQNSTCPTSCSCSPCETSSLSDLKDVQCRNIDIEDLRDFDLANKICSL